MVTSVMEILGSDEDSDLEDLCADTEPALPLASFYHSSLNSIENPSTEQRREEIEKARQALIATSQTPSSQSNSPHSNPLPAAPAPPPMTTDPMPPGPATATDQPAADIFGSPSDGEEPEPVSLAKSVSKPKLKAPTKRAATTPNPKKTIYDFATDSEEEMPAPKRKNPATSVTKVERSKTTALSGVSDDNDGFDPTSRARKRAKTSASPESATKSARATRGAKKESYYIPPPPGSNSPSPETSPRKPSSKKTTARRAVTDNISSPFRSSSKGFIVDLSNQVLPTQARQEYTVASVDSILNHESSFEPFTGSRLASSGNATVAMSTVPDDTQQLKDLPPLPTMNTQFLEPKVPTPIEAVTVEPAVSAHEADTIQVQSEVPAPGGPMPEPAQETAAHTPGPAPEPPKKTKKRAKTENLDFDSSMAVATEWRTAKGKSRLNYSDLIPLGDNDNGDEEYHSEGSKRKPTKRRKTKETKKAPSKKKTTKKSDIPVIVMSSDNESDTAPPNNAQPEEGAITVQAESEQQEEKSPHMVVKLHVRKQSSPSEEAKDMSDVSPTRPIKPTKSRFVHEESTVETTGPAERAAPQEAPVGPKKNGRKLKRRKTLVSDNEDEHEDPEESSLTPPPPSPPPKKETAAQKRKRTQSKKDAEAVEELSEQPEKPSPKNKRRKTAIKAEEKENESSAKEPSPPSPSLVQEPAPEPEPAKKEEQEDKRETSKTPAPEARSESKTPGTARKMGGLNDPIKFPSTPAPRFRVGLSKKRRIEPLLKSVKRE